MNTPIVTILLFGLLRYIVLCVEQPVDAELYASLFATYRKELRPVRTLEEQIPVKVLMGLSSIYGLDSSTQILTSAFFITLSWVDYRLKWNTTEERAPFLSVDPSVIWRPETIIRNAFNIHKLDGSMAIPAIVDSEGTVILTCFTVLQTRCSIDARKFPFDTQNCPIIFTFKNERFDNVTFSNDYEMSLTSFKDDTNWVLESMNMRTESGVVGNVTYSNLMALLALKRQPYFYGLNFVLPVVALTMINPFVFLLPVSHGERVSFCVSLLLSYTMALSVISSALPDSVVHVCLLNIFASISFLISASISICAFSFAKVEAMHGHCSPHCVTYKLIKFFCARRSCLSSMARPCPTSHGSQSVGTFQDSENDDGPNAFRLQNTFLSARDVQQVRKLELNDTRLDVSKDNTAEQPGGTGTGGSNEDQGIPWHKVASGMNRMAFRFFSLLVIVYTVTWLCLIAL